MSMAVRVILLIKKCSHRPPLFFYVTRVSLTVFLLFRIQETSHKKLPLRLPEAASAEAQDFLKQLSHYFCRNDCPTYACPILTAGSSAPAEVEATWYSDEKSISAEDLKAHEAPTFRTGGIPEDPPPRKFCV